MPETGAPQSRLYETVISLKEKGWAVAVVTAMPNYPAGIVFKDYRGKFYKKEELDGIDIYRYALYPSNSPKRIPRIFSMLSFAATALFSVRKLKRFKPDYIFTESPPLVLGMTGLLLARLTRARHIFNVSDLWPLSAYKLGAISDGRFYRSIVKMEKLIYRKSYACTGQSQEIVDHIKKEGGKNVHLFRNGVTLQRFAGTQRRENTPGGRLKIVYAGLLGMAQGIAGICRHINFKQLGAEFHIYGEGSERKEIEVYIKAHNDTGIIYHGVAGRNDIPGILAQADVALIPLIKAIEGAVPSKLYEAMAAGLPVIFSGGGEGEQIINTYNTGWVCTPRNYTEIAGCIARIVQEGSNVLEGKRANCIQAANNVFSREAQVEQLHRFLLKGIHAKHG